MDKFSVPLSVTDPSILLDLVSARYHSRSQKLDVSRTYCMEDVDRWNLRLKFIYRTSLFDIDHHYMFIHMMVPVTLVLRVADTVMTPDRLIFAVSVYTLTEFNVREGAGLFPGGIGPYSLAHVICATVT
jgi:hypothetical protein